MYISRVEIDTNNRRKIRNLTHLGVYHSWVEDSFPDEREHNLRTRKLWRVDVIDKKVYLIVVSQNNPKLSLLERYGIAGTAQTKNYEKFLDSISDGDKVSFRVALNPVISESQENGKRGRVKSCYDEESQINYLTDRAISNGFNIEMNSLMITERGFSILKKQEIGQIRLIKVVFEGILTVENSNLFRKVLVNGLGKHKAYGFGLMTVIPLVN